VDREPDFRHLGRSETGDGKREDQPGANAKRRSVEHATPITRAIDQRSKGQRSSRNELIRKTGIVSGLDSVRIELRDLCEPASYHAHESAATAKTRAIGFSPAALVLWRRTTVRRQSLKSEKPLTFVSGS
jgi:hypothetical protein